MTNFDQANLFLQEFEERYDHYYDLFLKKIDALEKTFEKESKEVERVLGLYNQEVADNGTEAASENVEIMRQLRDSSVQLTVVKVKCEKERKLLSALSEKFEEKSREAIQQLGFVCDDIEQQQNDQLQGLSATSIGRFQLFTADESHVGDQCSICKEDIDAGRRMRRLTCDGQHYFCQHCIEGWFAEHNTCPLCRHKFD